MHFSITGQGRWYSLEAKIMAQEDGVQRNFMHGIYEDDDVKENGIR
jgi:hypothetical protein